MLLPVARIAPISSNWACCQTRLENSGAKGVKTCTILGGRVRNSITSFWLIAVTSVPYPFHSQMAKVELEGPPNRRHEVPTSDFNVRMDLPVTFNWVDMHAGLTQVALTFIHRSGAEGRL